MNILDEISTRDKGVHSFFSEAHKSMPMTDTVVN